MRVLVTGAAGFLGTNLCETLCKKGYQVLGIDNYYTGMESNVVYLKETYSNFSFDKVDITESLLNRDWGHLDWILNLACPASPPHYQKDPIYTTKVSVIGVLNLMDLALKTGAKIFHTSTSEVYGDPKEHPQKESYWGNVNCTGIRSCYDEGKRCAESLLFDFNRTYKHPVKVVRIFNTYGPYMDPEDGRVVSNFILQALRGEAISIYGEGNQTRSFCYVDDLIRGFLAFMDTEDDCCGPVNLGNPTEFTMLELADKVLELTKSSSELRYLELPKDDPTRRKPDISKAKKLFSWEPEVSLDEGLKNTIKYFEKHI